MTNYNFYHHSSENMVDVESNSIALTVTSPPYWNAIDYDTFSEHGTKKNYRTRKYANGFQSSDDDGYIEYLNWCNSIFDEVYRVTKPGGFCAIVIGTILLKGRYFATPHDLLGKLIGEEPRWIFHQDIIWNKVTAGIRRAGVAIQKPYPGYFYPNIMTEYIHILRKPGEPIYKEINGHKKSSAYPIDELFKKDIANNIWHIAPVPPGIIDHPCPFPEEIPDRIIRLYSYMGDTILDPFLGSGQTAKVAVELGRKAIGYEVEKKYIELSEQRIREPSKIRKQQLVMTPRFSKVSVNRGELF